MSQYGHRLHKSWFNRWFGITLKHFTKQSCSLCSLHGKIGIQKNNTVYTSKEKNYEFSSKKPSATKHSPPSNVYYIEFHRNFLFQYNLIVIVKPKFTRRNEIWYRIWEIEDLSKNVRKKQDRTSLRCTCNLVHYYSQLAPIFTNISSITP